jgi:2-polyprenyl-3-methyl-5-hydroxy-6-metoxy-1,4-benzoquinol methylase
MVGSGMRVLDIACGEGRHSLAAASAGAEVIALDRDPNTLAAARTAAEQLGLNIDFRHIDLQKPWPDLGHFDVILVFNYLDRSRMDQMRDCLAPGGMLLLETYLLAQRDLGWGPTSDEHLLRPGELPSLVAPLDVIHCREVFEPVDSQKWRAVGSVVAQKR